MWGGGGGGGWGGDFSRFFQQENHFHIIRIFQYVFKGLPDIFLYFSSSMTNTSPSYILNIYNLRLSLLERVLKFLTEIYFNKSENLISRLSNICTAIFSSKENRFEFSSPSKIYVCTTLLIGFTIQYSRTLAPRY